MVQIRFLQWIPSKIADFMKDAVKVKGKLLLIINDRADMMMIGDLDGMHLKESSIDPEVMIPEVHRHQKIVGCSTHSHSRLRDMLHKGVDFATYGPVFDTPSKRGYGPPAGLIQLEAEFQSRVFPLGGISGDDIPVLKAAGFNRIALIRGISQADYPEKRAVELIEMLKETPPSPLFTKEGEKSASGKLK